jgi:acylphosphatase
VTGPPPVARRLSIAGRVQGVGYREAMVDAACAEGAVGWVRNRRDGTVEALVQGPPTAVDRVIAWCRQGPRLARVASVDALPAEPEPALVGFQRLPTA